MIRQEDLWRSATENERRQAEKQLRGGKRSPALYLILAALVMFVGLTLHTLRVRMSGAEIPAGRNLFITVCYALIAAVVIALTIQSVRTSRAQRKKRCLAAEGVCIARHRGKSFCTVELEQEDGTRGTVQVREEVFDAIRKGERVRIVSFCMPG